MAGSAPSTAPVAACWRSRPPLSRTAVARIVQFVEDLEMRMPTPEEAVVLVIPPGVPLARVFRTMHVASGEIVEVLDSRVPCDRHTFRYVIDIP